jgi:hypothetical protein
VQRSFGTNTQGCNHRIATKLWLVITVVPHRVTTITIQVAEYAVKRSSCSLLNDVPQMEQENSCDICVHDVLLPASLIGIPGRTYASRVVGARTAPPVL